MTSVKGWWVLGGALWRCHCKPFGHCGIRWHREQRRLHTVVPHSKPSWDSSPSNPIHSHPIQSNPHLIPNQSTSNPGIHFYPIRSNPIHPQVFLQQVLLNGCWLFFCPVINYDSLGWSQNNRNITRFSPNPLVGLRNCFLSFSFQPWVKMFSQPLGHKYFSQIFCFWFHDWSRQGGHLRLQLPP